MDNDYPVATIAGSSMTGVSHKPDENGLHFNEFADEAGKKYRAASGKAGRRTGHFMYETGKQFRGFADSTGKQVEQVRDEAGNVLDEASDWASHCWEQVQGMVGGPMDAVRHGARDSKAKAAQATRAMGEQVNSLNQTIIAQFRDQPLVAGALAFAVGATFDSALLHTEQVDKLMAMPRTPLTLVPVRKPNASTTTVASGPRHSMTRRPRAPVKCTSRRGTA